MPKVESTPCKKDGCTLYYENKGRLLCVSCAGESSRKQEAKKKALRLAYRRGLGCSINDNPFNPSKEPKLHQAWQTGFNDAKGGTS